MQKVAHLWKRVVLKALHGGLDQPASPINLQIGDRAHQCPVHRIQLTKVMCKQDRYLDLPQHLRVITVNGCGIAQESSFPLWIVFLKILGRLVSSRRKVYHRFRERENSRGSHALLVEITFLQMNNRAQVDAVLNGSIMLGIGHFSYALEADEQEQVSTRFLFRSAIVIVRPKNRRFQREQFQS
jgi:hypothetical protein